AIRCGIAMQITNILRDLKEDAAAGRVYLPQDDLARFGYSNDDLRRGIIDRRFRDLMRFEVARAESLYKEAAELDRWLTSDGRAVFGAMTTIYRGLLDEIKRADGNVFERRIRLTTWHKLRIAGRWLLLHPPHTVRPPFEAARR
ncbi:MAG TPA: squalene/phytoene synthase family protein, partial [Pirellulales bacterium]|nr:squalene/phytoene synthase family protein [Pirellulales bacterium]